MKIKASGCADISYPSDIMFGLLWLDEKQAIQLLPQLPFRGEWGEILTPYEPIEDNMEFPSKISILWLSLVERCFYEYEGDLDMRLVNSAYKTILGFSETDEMYYVIGTGPEGKLSIWLASSRKSVLIGNYTADKVSVNLRMFKPGMPEKLSLEEYCAGMLKRCGSQIRYACNSDTTKLWDIRQRQYALRYVILLEKWDDGGKRWTKPEKDYSGIDTSVSVKSIDGTYSISFDSRLMDYHLAGAPYKLKIHYVISKREYSIYFWINELRIAKILERFYGVHPDTKTDFIIRIDLENKKYEIALYRQGLKEPVIIPEAVYQMIVFKNKFEYDRSQNYIQPRGSWNW